MSIINDVLVDKLFKDPSKRTKEIPLLSEKTVSGDGMLVINDAYPDFPIKNLTLTGNTEQLSTTGKNLWSAESTVEVNQTKQIFFDNPIPAGEYVFSANVKSTDKESNKSLLLFYYTDSGSIGGALQRGNRSSAKLTFARDVKSVTLHSGQNANESNGDTSTFEDIQIEKGTTATPYEPYTGGKPSPSPEYPQEIKNVGKYNKGTGKYDVDVTLNGSNLWNENTMIRGRLTNNGEVIHNEKDSSCIYTVVAPRDGKYTARVEKDNTNGLYFTAIFNGEFTQPYVRVAVGKKGVLTIKKGENKIQVSSLNSVLLTGTEKVMLSYGDEEPPIYEPYKEPQTLTLTSDRPITKWDKLVEQDGQIGWLYKHKTIEDFSTLVKDTEPIYGNDGEKYFSVSLQDASLNYDSRKIYSEVGTCGGNNKIHYIPRPMMESTIIYVSDTDTIMTAKEHMHYKVVYETVGSEFIPLPQSEQDAIRALKTYYPTTVITADGGELPVGIEVTYMRPDYIPTKQYALRMWFKENPII